MCLIDQMKTKVVMLALRLEGAASCLDRRNSVRIML